MTQSLPGIASISYLPCHNLAPNIMEKHLAGIPIGVYALSTPVEFFGDASCDAESEYTNGAYAQKTSLQFSTCDNIDNSLPLAFVITDVQGNSFLVGCRERPFPIVEIRKVLDVEKNVFEVKVVSNGRRSLIPCYK